jgi:protein-S-isoprenylcysteine O-methyltransferase Ste14
VTHRLKLRAPIAWGDTGIVDAMTRGGAAVGSFLFAVGMPGVMAGLVPYSITGGWKGSGAPLVLQAVGAALLLAGVGALTHTVLRFVVEGRGTPFPAAPTENLVVGGLYRYVRNPMYLAVIAIILGQAAILGSAALLLYAAIIWVTVASFVRFYEEPTLANRYGDRYEVYRRAVRGWLPRATPWSGDDGTTRSERSASEHRPRRTSAIRSAEDHLRDPARPEPARRARRGDGP